MKTLRNFIFWSYERGSLQYDVMVTLILVFLFVGPQFIDFKDKPVLTVPLHPSEVLVKSTQREADGEYRFTYEIRSDDLGSPANPAELKSAIMRTVEPIAGEVTLESYGPVVDTHGKIVAYDATVRR